MTEPFSMDQALIRKLTAIVLTNISDEDFGAQQLAENAGMSHASLHRKLKAITNTDISRFIREVRLKRAMEMLQNNEGTVAEIAYRVGFGSATYFSKCFREYVGYPPGEVRKIDSMSNFQSGLEKKHDHLSFAGKDKQKGNNVLSQKFHNAGNKVLIFSGILSFLILCFILYSIFVPWQFPGKGSLVHQKSIIVLPFKNLSDDKENQ
jgi:AraC-like DNA-binding protein